MSIVAHLRVALAAVLMDLVFIILPGHPALSKAVDTLTAGLDEIEAAVRRDA